MQEASQVLAEALSQAYVIIDKLDNIGPQEVARHRASKGVTREAAVTYSRRLKSTSWNAAFVDDASDAILQIQEHAEHPMKFFR